MSLGRVPIHLAGRDAECKDGTCDGHSGDNERDDHGDGAAVDEDPAGGASHRPGE